MGMLVNVFPSLKILASLIFKALTICDPDVQRMLQAVSIYVTYQALIGINLSNTVIKLLLHVFNNIF